MSSKPSEALMNNSDTDRAEERYLWLQRLAWFLAVFIILSFFAVPIKSWFHSAGSENIPKSQHHNTDNTASSTPLVLRLLCDEQKCTTGACGEKVCKNKVHDSIRKTLADVDEQIRKERTEIKEQLAENYASSSELSNLSNRVGDIATIAQIVGITSGLFGILLTVLVVFYSLRESENINNRFEESRKTLDGLESGIQNKLGTVTKAAEEATKAAEEATKAAEEATKAAKGATKAAEGANETINNLDKRFNELNNKYQQTVSELNAAKNVLNRLIGAYNNHLELHLCEPPQGSPGCIADARQEPYYVPASLEPNISQEEKSGVVVVGHQPQAASVADSGKLDDNKKQ